MVLRTSVDGYLAATAALQGLDVKPRLGGVTAPVWFVCGEADGPHPQEMRDMAARTPGSTFVEIPGAAHLSNLERPDAFNAAMLAALESVA
jgi:3-oxoadipate enol-lactonase